MKKNLVIVVLALALIVSLVLAYCRDGEMAVSESTTVMTPVVAHRAPETSEPVAPKSETSVSAVDQKLEVLGFAPSANVHRITVQK